MHPSFYDAKAINDLYVERASLVASEAKKVRANGGITDAIDDKFKVAVLGIDPQIGFCTTHGSLFVPGADADMARTIEWIYSNVSRITKFFISLDTHTVNQVFHPAFWIDKDGNHPEPFTVITSKDIIDNKWSPAIQGQKDFNSLKTAMIDYTSQLEKGGKYSLTIWPYHTLLGGVSHAVVPSLMEALIFHSTIRRIDHSFIIKGSNPYTENFSVFSPEVTAIIDASGKVVQVGKFNTGLVDVLRKYDRVYVFGQAKSHCVLSTLASIHGMYGSDKDFMKKIFILEDTMSAIPAPPVDPLPDALNFPKVTEEAFATFEKAGMNRVVTKEPEE